MAMTVQLTIRSWPRQSNYHTIMATTVQLPYDHGHDSPTTIRSWPRQSNYHTIMAMTVQLPYDHGHDSPTTIRSMPQSHYEITWVWFLWCYFQQYFSFIRGGNQMTLRKPDLQQVIDKLNNIMLYTLPWVGFELTISVVMGIDCMGVTLCHEYIMIWLIRLWPFSANEISHSTQSSLVTLIVLQSTFSLDNTWGQLTFDP
jgi:hypothetical protein